MNKKTVAKAEQTTALTVVQRAALAVRSTPELKKELATLAEGSKHITTITNPDGRAQVHTALMALKNCRIDIEKIGKDARDDATKFSKAVIAEEDSLVALIQPEEDRLQAIRDEWDDRLEAERLAKVRAEQQRVAAIQERITDMHTAVNGAARARTAADVQLILDDIDAIVIDQSFAEFADVAADTKASVYEQIKATHESFVAREAEAARLAAERAELDKKRAEQEARDKVERDRIAAETAAENERLRKDREKFEAEQAQARAEQAAAQKRIDDANAELVQRQREDQERREAAERAEREERERVAREAEAEAERQRKANFVPALEDVCEVLAAHYEVTVDRVLEWLPKLVKRTRKAA